MPPSIGGTSFPQLSGQSEMARDASLLVTRAPATTSARVHNAVNTAKRRSPDEGISTFWRSRAKWDRPPGRSVWRYCLICSAGGLGRRFSLWIVKRWQDTGGRVEDGRG